jgi:hypothetical protein
MHDFISFEISTRDPDCLYSAASFPKWWIVAQAEAAAFWKTQAQERCVDDSAEASLRARNAGSRPEPKGAASGRMSGDLFKTLF